MRTNRYYIIAALLLILPILSSCRQGLCYDHYPSMDVAFEWEQEWERDYGNHHLNSWDADYYGKNYDELRPDKPEWVNMINYYDDGRKSDSFLSPDGKLFIVEQGHGCSILLYNGDTEYIVLSDVASLNDARASATSRSRASLDVMQQKHADARTTNPPDILYSAFLENIPALKNHDRHKLQVKMQPLVYTYMINYEFDAGINQVILARGAIGGMAESVYLRTGVTSKETSIILFDCDVKSTGCHAQVRSFGVPNFPDIYYGRTAEKAEEQPYTLNLELKLRNGKTVEFNYDITDQMKNQPRGGVITVKGIKLEDEEIHQTASGFDVDVSGWNENVEEVDLTLDRLTNT